MRATKEEVAFLHGRFEAELSRQAAKAAEAARQAALVVSQMQKTKKAERSQLRTRTGHAVNGDAVIADSDKGVVSGKAKSKKTKRSALANASNPHHLRNYVPSRLPHSGANNSSPMGAQNHLSPLPLRFLSAELPPRRKRNKNPVMPLINLTNPEEEWICASCEYSLFYGDEQSYRRVVRQRKKILARRRRAMERAAAAAAGRKGIAPSDKGDTVADDSTDVMDAPPQAQHIIPKHSDIRHRGEQDRDRDKDRERGVH